MRLRLHTMHYNFVGTHKTPRVTPAKGGGRVEQTREIGDIAKLVEDAKERAKKPGSYRKRAAAS